MTVADLIPPQIDLIVKERPGDAAQVDKLVARAFGPGRYAKTAERLREGSQAAPGLSFAAWRDDQIVGSVRLWPVRIGANRALLLGPIAVEQSDRRRGLGAELVRHALAAAGRAGWDLVILVGDLGFFGPLGFSAGLAKHVRLPGPVDQRRVMIRELRPGAAAGLSGPVTIAA